MNDCHVRAWNVFDECGNPLYKVDQVMSFEQYRAQVAGKYAYNSTQLLRAISSSAIDRLLEEQGS